MKMIKPVLIGTIAMTLISFGANAANSQGSGIVNFKGSVINAPCGIDPESADQTIDFGQISKSNLNQGGTSGKKDVKIKLVNCDFSDPAFVNKTVEVTFSGTNAGDDESLGLSDTNAVIKMTGQDGKYVKFDGTTGSNITKLMDGNNMLSYQAWVKKGAQPVTEGEFVAAANFNLAYN